jgi:hypothetical protein
MFAGLGRWMRRRRPAHRQNCRDGERTRAVFADRAYCEAIVLWCHPERSVFCGVEGPRRGYCLDFGFARSLFRVPVRSSLPAHLPEPLLRRVGFLRLCFCFPCADHRSVVTNLRYRLHFPPGRMLCPAVGHFRPCRSTSQAPKEYPAEPKNGNVLRSSYRHSESLHRLVKKLTQI